MTNKRELVLSLLDESKPPEYIPAAFFLHFPPKDHRGQAAVDRHMEYFRATGMDFVKIQYENSFPKVPSIQKPEDWAKMPFYGLDFYEEPLRVVEGLVKAAKHEALVIMTLYSPYMCAGHTTSDQTITEHIKENPEAVKKGMQIITDSLMGFVKAAIGLGLDGFYMSTQGGEAGRLPDRALFDQCIRPYDLSLMNEIDRLCIFNILHICDYHMPYASLEEYTNYPGQVVNASLELTTGRLKAADVAKIFDRSFMGGMDRKGVIGTGSPETVRQAAQIVLNEAPERFILGADCTIPGNTPVENIRAAIDAAHAFKR
jgi:uroporphyrinogen decarboxylase